MNPKTRELLKQAWTEHKDSAPEWRTDMTEEEKVAYKSWFDADEKITDTFRTLIWEDFVQEAKEQRVVDAAMVMLGSIQ